MAIGPQSVDQVPAACGPAVANTAIENCNNAQILRCEVAKRGGTAQFASELIGEREVEHDETSTSHLTGQHKLGDACAPVAEKAVLASQIIQVPDQSGYLKLAGQAEWNVVSFAYLNFSAVTEPPMAAGPVDPPPWAAPNH